MSDDQACDLCGLEIGPKPFLLESGGKSLRFCCDGCLGIYQMLHESEPSPSVNPNPTKGETP